MPAYTNGYTHPFYTDEKVKEAPFYSGRGRPLRVVCIGAGAAGIYLAIKLPRSFREGAVDLQIYEKNPDFGGCWYENVYPGCACDIPSHVYSYSFAPNPDWTNFYSSSQEIQKYFKGVALKYKTEQYVAFEHRVISAYWDETDGLWNLKIQQIDGSVISDFADVLINASGILNAWKWPNIDGLNDFEGPKLHSANWDHNVKFTSETKIAVIGNGSSAIQIVPKLQPIVKQLDTFIRTKTWIALPFTSGKITASVATTVPGLDPIEALAKAETSNPPYSEEEKRKFREVPGYLENYRKEIEHENNSRFTFTTLKESPGALAAIPKLAAIMTKRLAKKPELAEVLIPEWSVGCRRLTPGVGYLEALCEPNVNVVTSPIVKIVKNGIVTKDGVLHDFDVLVCATGFDVSTRPHFDVVGRDGYVFTDEWAKSPKGYLSVAMSNMPNYFLFNGPNAPIANGSLIPAMEAEGNYIIQMIDKILREDIRAICVKQSAEKTFCEYTDAWMPRSIWASPCVSWYKGGTADGRVSGVWPGSILHFMEMLKRPRFEDYDYTYLKADSPWAFMGNGFTLNDVDPQADKAPYLDGATIPV